MALCIKGDLVPTPFPFSDDEDFKVRPALVLAVLPYGKITDYLVCIVTTQSASDPLLLSLTNADIDGGCLSQNCTNLKTGDDVLYGHPVALKAVNGDHLAFRQNQPDQLLWVAAKEVNA